MLFKRIGLLLLFGLTALMSSSCGMLGNKSDLNRLLNYNPNAVGCMNSIGTHVKSYYQGTIDAETWGGVWECATTNLALFKRFVKATDANGFTQDDIREFVSKFLITNKPISKELVAALFELKASLFGGDKGVISPAEWDKVLSFLDVLKEQSTVLLPQMAARATAASPQNLLALVDALNEAAVKISDGLKTTGNPTFSFTAVQTMAREVGTILDIDVSPELVTWLTVVKVLLTAGDTTGISASDWPVIFKSLVSYGGPALAMFSVDDKYLTEPNAQGRFILDLGWKIKTSMLQTLDLYGGALPLTALDKVLDALPSGWLTVTPATLKLTMRPAVNKLFQSRVPNAIDSSAIDLLFSKFQIWSDSQTALEGVYVDANAGPAGLTFKDFNAAAQTYLKRVSIKEQDAVRRMIALAKDTAPMFVGEDNQISFVPTLNHSLHNLSLFNIFSIVSETVVKAYSSTPDKKYGKLQDLEILAKDFTDIARELHASDLTVATWAAARFTEGTLFTYASRGDTDTLDMREAMYLIAMGYSAGQASEKLKKGQDAACPSLGIDILGYNWKPIQCFRKELFNNYQVYWDHAPMLVRYFANLSAKAKDTFQEAIETCSRRYGVSEQPVGSQDLFGYSGIVQYVEAVLARWDANGDGHLNLSEADKAYPIFKGPLAVQGGISKKSDFLLKAIFTFLLKNGHPPEKNLKGILALGLWIAQKPFWSVKADRLVIYQVIASIVKPEPVPTTPKLAGMRSMSFRAAESESAPNSTPVPQSGDDTRPDEELSYEELAIRYGVDLENQVSPLVDPALMDAALLQSGM